MTVLSDNAAQIARTRYFRDENEDWEGLSSRVGPEIARVENGRTGVFADRFAEMIYNMEFLPGGRILRNTGRLRGSLFNCYVLPLRDSIEDIGQFIKESLIVWAEGGGVGTNVSYLRPEDAPIKGKGGKSSGPISFLMADDAAAACIESGGQRRAAGLALMTVNHPDITKFIEAKTVHRTLSHFNISVGVTEEFLEAVETRGKWDLTFNQKVYGTVDAFDVWTTIMENMVRHAEPGLINWKNLRNNNSYYFAPIECSNPCGEAPLEKYGICDLGSLVLTKFVANINTNWKRMEEVIRLGIRFLDNVIEVNKYIFKAFDKSAHDARRIGVGVMGLADYLFAKRIRYGSHEAVAETEKLFKFIRNVSYDESIRLAVEKGAFPKFDPTAYGKAHFVRTLPASTRMSIKKHGMRNCTTMAIAPTGTISLLPEVCSGIEPLMAKAYERRDRVSDRFYVHPKFERLVWDGRADDPPDWLVDSYDLEPSAHLDMQAVVQKYVDGAVSKTINMPKSTTPSDLSDLLLEYIHDLKGVTVYVDESREGQPIRKVDVESAVGHILAGETTDKMDGDAVRCASGKCDI